MNPRAAEALVGKGEAALQKLEIKQADGFADQALKINPRLPVALLLKSDVQLDSGDVAAALATVEKALAVNPRDEHTLARKAACLQVMQQEGRLQTPSSRQSRRTTPSRPCSTTTSANGWRTAVTSTTPRRTTRRRAELQPMLPGPAGSSAC